MYFLNELMMKQDLKSELFNEKQINFVQMFSLYFKLVSQYLELKM